MAAVAPVGDEITNGAEFFPGLRRRAQIGQRIVVPADQRLPGRSAGADVKGNFRFRELRRFLCQTDDLPRNPSSRREVWSSAFRRLPRPLKTERMKPVRDEFWIFQNDVAPEHHRFAARGNFAVNLFQKIEIDPAFAFGFAKLFALATAQVPGLVAADVEEPAGKVRQQFIVKSAQERAGCRDDSAPAWSGGGQNPCWRLRKAAETSASFFKRGSSRK